MRGDFSRRTFRANRHYSSVRLQQGRVLVDADWHEQIDIDQHRDRTTTRDVSGRTGAPMDEAGFGIGAAVDLSGVDMFDADRAVAVGARGAILTTADGGATWRRRPATGAVPQGDLIDVHAATANTAAAVGTGGLILTTGDSGQAWTLRPVAGLNTTLRSVLYADGTTAVAVGDNNRIVRGAGAGSNGTPNWTLAASVASGHSGGLRDVDRPSGTNWVVVGLQATILRSTDGGDNWAVVAAPSGVTADLLGLSFGSSTDGWVVGDDATILRTTDGGQTWTEQAAPDGVTATLRGVRFIDANNGWAVGDDGTVLRTTDGGSTWTGHHVSSPAGDLTGVDFANATTGLAVGAGFALYATTDRGVTWEHPTPPLDLAEGTDLAIGRGRMYVDGILVENDAPTTYDTQPDSTGLAVPTVAAPTRFLAYLDVWQRHLTALDRPSIREIALGGPDHATRTQTVWQVQVAQIGADDVCSDFDSDDWTPPGSPPSTGRLRARGKPGPPAIDECMVPPNGGFTRLENQHYRVEVQVGGNYTVDAASNVVLKWSRENGSVATRLEDITNTVGDSALTLGEAGRDSALAYKTGDVLELSDDARTLRGEAGVLVTVGNVEGRTVHVSGWPGGTPLEMTDFGMGASVRGWEGLADAADGWIDLENGVQIELADGEYRVGDWWSFPARTLNAGVEWPAIDGDPVFEPRHGTLHSYAPLALLEQDAVGDWEFVADCRKLFPPLTELRHLIYVAGSGQEVMPDPGGDDVLLTQPLEAAVVNGMHPVAGARVLFKIADGDGQLSSAPPVATGADGIASVDWSVDSLNHTQLVTATLLDDQDDAVAVPVRFTATLSRADEVRYSPGDCKNLARDDTVQDAIDKLADLTGMVKLNGDNQILLPGRSLMPLVVRIENLCGAPIDGGSVHWEIETPNSGVLGNGGTGEDRQIVNGQCDCEWEPGNVSGTQVVVARLDKASSVGVDLPVAAPLPQVRFTAVRLVAGDIGYEGTDCALLQNAETVREALEILCQNTGGGGPEEGVRVKVVTAAGEELQNDTIITQGRFERGIVIHCNDVIEPKGVARPTCFVTAEVPWPIAPLEVDDWGDELAGFRPVVLLGNTAVEDERIAWRPAGSAVTFLDGALQRSERHDIRNILLRLTLLGNFVWGAEERRYVDGDAFADTETAAPELHWRPDSGDGRRGGKFELWFWYETG